MATTARQPKPTKKTTTDSVRRPAPAWGGARASPTFASATSNRPINSPASSSQGNFPHIPPQPNGARADNSQDRVLQSLSGLTGTTITLLTKTSQHYEGVILSTSGEGNTTGVTLKDVKEISNPGGPLKDTFFIASTNIASYSSGPADSKMPNGDSFRTDTDISHNAQPRRERDLQVWNPETTSTTDEAATNGGDEDTFGPGASSTNMSWDQFAANEKMFGVKVGFDEDAYTTKLDRSAADFKERERKAQRLANEINGAGSTNAHIAEERNQNIDDSGLDEEDKYGAVVRGKDAYVPPGARRFPGSPPAGSVQPAIPQLSVNAPDGAAVSPNRTQSPMPSKATNKPPADAVPAFREFVTSEKEKLTIKRQALAKSEMDKRKAELVQFSLGFKLNKPIPDDLVPILAKDEAKQQQIREKSTKDAGSTQARNIGVASAVNLAPGLRAAPPTTAKATVSKPTSSEVKQPANAASGASASAKGKIASAAPSKPAKSSMFIQDIPAFKGSKSRQSSHPNTHVAAPQPQVRSQNTTSSARQAVHVQPIPAFVPTAANHSAGKMSPTTAANNRLNVNASSFMPTKASSPKPTPSVTPSASASNVPVSPRPAAANSVSNAFFGTRQLKKNVLVHLKDDFNPFKNEAKVPVASSISTMWSAYTGKRYATMFPPPQHAPPQQHSPHMSAPGPPPMPPPSYEEDSAAQAAARGYVYAYPPYGYPGGPMMPGMPPPGPPGAYMPGPFMQHMPYPPGMPPPNGYPMYAPNMGQMPPPQAYMQPPPGQYPPPNGGGPRQSMPPTPIPSHAHPYYHQSPQMQHAMAYPIMMPPPGQGGPQQPQPHGYDNGQSQPVQMGAHP